MNADDDDYTVADADDFGAVGCCGQANLIDFAAACLHFALTFEPHWFYTYIYAYICIYMDINCQAKAENKIKVELNYNSTM